PAAVCSARYPAAEILVQAPLFGGLLAFVAALETPSRALAAVAGAGLGAVHLAKIETFPLPFLVAAFLVYQSVTGRLDRRWLWFIVPYVVLLLQAIVHAIIFASWYAATTFQKVLTPATMGAALAATLLAIVGVALAFWLAPRFPERPLLGSTVHLSAAVGLVSPALIAAFAAYAYYVRPLASLAIGDPWHDLARIQVLNDL